LTATGLQVFDKNSTPALPGNDVRCLLETRDGALWIGTSEGLARWKDGAVTAFSTKDGLPGNGIRALVESENGSLWVWTDQELARLNEEGRFVDATSKTGFPASAIATVISDGRGELWVGTQDRVSIFRGIRT
jgi:ligand-binding sensor domain-containing protein